MTDEEVERDILAYAEFEMHEANRCKGRGKCEWCEDRMDEWLVDAPALLYARDLRAWFVFNSMGEPISWTENREEAEDLAKCIDIINESKTRKGNGNATNYWRK